MYSLWNEPQENQLHKVVVTNVGKARVVLVQPYYTQVSTCMGLVPASRAIGTTMNLQYSTVLDKVMIDVANPRSTANEASLPTTFLRPSRAAGAPLPDFAGSWFPYKYAIARYAPYSKVSTRLSMPCAPQNPSFASYAGKPYTWSTVPYNAYRLQIGLCSHPPGMECGRSSTYPVSQITKGRDTRSHTRVSVDGVCDQADIDLARGRKLIAVEDVGVLGVESFEERVERLLGEEVFVGVMSGGGNCPGWERVETIVP
jgi:hypothetical protein